MAGYQKKSMQLLGGSLNLLPPGDKVPKTDYLLAQNWRVDREGKLVSRFGYTYKFNFSTLGSAPIAHSAGVHGGIEGDYYVGCNTSVASPTPSSVFWNFNGSAIATGFDGNRIAFAGMNGWFWIMNRGKQCRHQAVLGAGVSQAWNLTAPNSSPAASSTAAPGTSSSVTFNYTLQGNAAYIHSLTINGVIYQFAENGFTGAQLPGVIASLAWQDPNATVSYSGSGSAVVITPKVPNVLVQVQGSPDGGAGTNPFTNLADGAVTALPNGVYTFFYTFGTLDETLESNPSPGSAPITLANQAASLTGIAVSSDARVGMRNIYAIGGTLEQAYLIGSILDNVTTTWSGQFSDLTVTGNDVEMPTTNDPPPAASGMVGPHFSRLFAWSTAANPNRLFYTAPGLPQYWRGSNDPAIGDWVDVGDEGEAIVWCTVHTNVFVIYKEKSIWMLVGDPSTGYLQKMVDGVGISGAFGVVNAGAVDYLVGAGGLYLFNLNQLADGAGNIRPLFQGGLISSTPTGILQSMGTILPGSALNANDYFPYAVRLGYGMGKLYLSYPEAGTPSNGTCMLVYHEQTGRWFSHRTQISGTLGIQGFIFDGLEMVGLTSGPGFAGDSVGVNLDDFTDAATTDAGDSIYCVYQSHYEDAGLPDNQKKWLEVVIDYEFAGDTGTVYVGYDNGTTAPAWLGAITGTARRQTGFALGTDGVLAKNISVAITVVAAHSVIIHNVYLYYYEEARLAQAASTIPIDLGVGKIKQCKELELDIDASNGIVNVNVYSDMPGNALAVRATPAVSLTSGRALMKYPLNVGPATIPPSYYQGYLWRLALTAATGPFRLYAARLLMRVIGTFVEGYEAANGFVWDSMELSFETAITKIPRTFAIALAAIPIKRFREISLEIETYGGNVTLNFLTDLPGNAQAVRMGPYTINTGTAGRRYFRIPLPAGLLPPIEGRLCRLQLSGSSQFALYDAAVELLPVGVYVEAYEAAGGAVFDSREQDWGVPGVKECRELELDIETSGVATVEMASDISWVGNVETPIPLALTAGSTANTSGRQKVLVPLTINAALDQFLEGRMLRLIISSANAFRLYGARMKLRVIGTYVDINEAQGGALWDSTELDLGSQTVKQLRELELEIWAYGAYTVTVYTDLPGNAMASRQVFNQAATGGRTAVQLPLPQGAVPDNYLYGRLVRVTITSAACFKLYGARIHARAIGVYAETYEASLGAVWDSMAQDLGSPEDKYFDQVRFEMDTDGAATAAVYTDLPGESMSERANAALTSGATSRHWATLPLAASGSGNFAGSAFGVEGRSIRTIVSSAAGFRLYRAQVRACRIGRYLAVTPPSGTSDAFNTLEFDFQSAKLKTHKKLEIDLAADGVVTLTVYTTQETELEEVWSTTITTPNGRMPFKIPMPPGIRGTILRISLSSPVAARVFRLRTWSRELNKSDAQWGWDDYPLEATGALPEWKDIPLPPTPAEFTWSALPVDPTKPEFSWAPFPVPPTPPGTSAPSPEQWIWGKVLSAEGTPDAWQWVDVPFEVTGQ